MYCDVLVLQSSVHYSSGCRNCIVINNFITVVALFPVRAYKSKFEFH